MRRWTRSCLLLWMTLLIVAACGPAGPDTPAPAAPTPVPAPVTEVMPPTSTWTPAPTRTPTPTAVPSATAVPPTPARPRGLIARQHLEALAVTIGPRSPGSPEEAQAARYIQGTFVSLGYVPQWQPFSITVEVDGQEATLSSANVIAVKAGSSSQEIIVGAHYDSVAGSAGADDNAAAVAVLLEAAALVQNVPTPCTVRFIAFGAEELHMDGSRYYVGRMSAADIRNTVAMINLDGLIAGDFAYVYGSAGTPGSLRDWILQKAPEEGLELDGRTAAELVSPDGTPCDCSDYSPFEAAGIPFAYFEASNWNVGEQDGWTQVDPRYGDEGQIRHTEYDTVAYIESTFPGRIANYLDLFVTLLYDALTQFQ